MAGILTPEKFYAAERHRPLEWGRNDCVHLADQWARQHFRRSFVDFSARDFSSQKEAEQMARQWALPIWVARAMRRGGFERVREPTPGDIALIEVGGMVACAVRGTGKWLFRSAGIGATSADVRTLGIWRG